MKAKRLLSMLSLVLVAVLLLANCNFPLTPPPPAAAPAAEATVAPTEETTGEAAEAAPAEIDPERTLVSSKVDTAPTLDGVGDETFWAEVPVLKVTVEEGTNIGTTDVHLQSVYTDDSVYFLITWADPTQSFLRSPWVKQADGSWSKLTDPNDRGGDNNLYYEDKLAMIWPINESIPRFRTMGCFAACHDDEGGDVKPYGNKYTSEEGQLGDIWHWKSVRNLNQVDDQYLDWTRYSPETPEAGRHSDPKEGSGGYVDNQTEDKTLPMWMGTKDFPRDGNPGYLLDTEKQPFDDSLFAADEMIPGIVKSPFAGDRGDFTAGWQWADGVWTLEFGRALVTGSEYDVQFDDLTKPYSFGVAIFDNAQVRHAYHTRARMLSFAQ